MTTALAATPNSLPRRSLVLAGGGMRVAYQAGVLRALDEASLRFFHADGTSGGTINLAMLLSGLTPLEMCERWKTLKVKDFVSLLPLGEYLHATHLPAMGDADGIIDKVFPHLGIDAPRLRAARGLVGTFNVCNYTRKTNCSIEHTAMDLDLLVAGISLPIFMPPVEKDGELYMDSVWIKDANCLEAVRRGADEIYLVWCIGNHSAYLGGAFNQYVHMIELSANGVLFEEFARIRELNDLIAAGVRGPAVYGREKPVVLHVIKPEYPLPLDPDFYAGKIDAATLIEMGYRDAWTYLRDKQDNGVPFTPEATHMQTPTVGISFRESMAGPFALGATDPHAGAEQGKKAGTDLTMRATIRIEDLNRFVTDPEHAGGIVGAVDFPPLGMDMPSKGGKFNLFSSSDDPRLKYMVYELAFSAGGKDYYMAGKKEVRDDPGLDMWKDTTTLLTRLHEGSDASGRIVGAGIIHLSMLGLLKMVPTMTVLNAGNAMEKARALETFGRFFGGKLFDTYVKPAPKV